jgi:hypothetical protein
MIIGRALFQNLLIGIGSMTAAFFILEYVLQKMMVPYFFPDGGLYVTPNTLRMRIRTRLVALIFACNLIPFLALIIIVRGTYRAPYLSRPTGFGGASGIIETGASGQRDLWNQCGNWAYRAGQREYYPSPKRDHPGFEKGPRWAL